MSTQESPEQHFQQRFPGFTFGTSTGEDRKWLPACVACFPESERLPPEQIVEQCRAGIRYMFQIRNAADEVIALCIIHHFINWQRPAQSFIWLSYFCVDPQSQCQGIGSLFFSLLANELRRMFPGVRRLYWAIEAIGQKEENPEVIVTRVRRKHFYTRQGARFMPEGTVYLFPNFQVPDNPHYGELGWYTLSGEDGAIDNANIRHVITTVFELYQFPPLAGAVIASQFGRVLEDEVQARTNLKQLREAPPEGNMRTILVAVGKAVLQRILAMLEARMDLRQALQAYEDIQRGFVDGGDLSIAREKLAVMLVEAEELIPLADRTESENHLIDQARALLAGVGQQQS